MSISEILIEKIDTLKLSAKDLPEYYKTYIEIANNTENIQKYCEGWSATIFFDTGSSSDHWIKIDKGKLSFGMGRTEKFSVKYGLSEEAMLSILSMNYDYILPQYGISLNIEGDISDSDLFIWVDSAIRGKILSIINKTKTNLEVKDISIMSYEDYQLMSKNLRSKLQKLEEYRKTPFYNSDPEAYDSIGLRIERRAKDDPDRIALFFEDEKYTNFEFNEMINKYANFFLKEVGLKKGDVAVVYLENRSEIFFVIIAMAKIGVISSLINTRQREQTLIHSIKLSTGKIFIIGEELLDPFLDILDIKDGLNLTPEQSQGLYFVSDKGIITAPVNFIDVKSKISKFSTKNPPTTQKIQMKDPYSYIFTSGTTGMPKAAIITNAQTIGSAFYWGKIVCDMGPEDVTYITTPIFHSNAINIGFASALGGGGAMAIRRKYSASNFLKDARRYGCTMFNYVGEICRYLYNQPPRDDDKDHPIIKCAGNGIKPEFWMNFKNRFGIKYIFEQYGATEVGIPNFANHLNIDKTVGISLSTYVMVKYDIDLDEPVKDKNGHMIRVEPGEVGLLLGKTNPDTYYMYKDKEATRKKVFRNVFIEDDMWINTGDLLRDIGFRHALFADRLGDTYRWKGENVSTEEMEIIINSFDQIEISCAYGVLIPNTEGRAGMFAFVKKGEEDFNLKKFTDFVMDRIPPYAVPVFLRLKKVFETTATDKIQKVKLKNEGYNPVEIKDPMYVLLPGSKIYEPLTPEIYERIQKKEYRF